MNTATEMKPPVGLDAFLEAHGWGGAVVTPVAGDASFRRYFRIASDDGRHAILMDAPPPHEDPRPFISIAEYLISQGFRGPEIYARDLQQGLVLLEDFGDERMREHVDYLPDDEVPVYTQAIDTLIALAGVPPADIPPYDEEAYLREVQLLSEWYMPAMGLEFDAGEYDRLWIEALEPISGADQRTVTVLRDYHAENIMLLPDGSQGIIDFQDALVGHPAYDLVSLLQDARRDVSPELEAQMLDHYRAKASPNTDFDLHYALLGAQRNTKIIGIFTRLWKRDGKERYLSFLPRMWRLLERDLDHPGLAKLKDWFDANVPHDMRAKSPGTVSAE